MRFIPIPPLREVFGLWMGRRRADGWGSRIRSAVLLVVMIACMAAAMAVIAGVIGFTIGLFADRTIG